MLDELTNLDNYITSHKAFAGPNLVGTPGFDLPRFTRKRLLQLNDDNAEYLKSKGIRYSGRCRGPNFVLIEDEMDAIDLNLTFSGDGRNLIVIGPGSVIRGNMNFLGGHHIFICAGMSVNSVGVSVTFRSFECGLFLGSGGAAAPVNYWIDGPGEAIIVGNDFIMSWGIWLRLSDSHAIIDLKTKSMLNLPSTIIIHPHVWLGQDVIVMGGNDIGAGSIIGARAVVTKSVPGASVAVGMPAKVVRTGVSWSRFSHPTPEQIDDVVNSPLFQQHLLHEDHLV